MAINWNFGQVILNALKESDDQNFNEKQLKEQIRSRKVNEDFQTNQLLIAKNSAEITDKAHALDIQQNTPNPKFTLRGITQGSIVWDLFKDRKDLDEPLSPKAVEDITKSMFSYGMIDRQMKAAGDKSSAEKQWEHDNVVKQFVGNARNLIFSNTGKYIDEKGKPSTYKIPSVYSLGADQLPVVNIAKQTNPVNASDSTWRPKKEWPNMSASIPQEKIGDNLGYYVPFSNNLKQAETLMQAIAHKVSTLQAVNEVSPDWNEVDKMANQIRKDASVLKTELESDPGSYGVGEKEASLLDGLIKKIGEEDAQAHPRYQLRKRYASLMEQLQSVLGYALSFQGAANLETAQKSATKLDELKLSLGIKAEQKK